MDWVRPNAAPLRVKCFKHLLSKSIFSSTLTVWLFTTVIPDECNNFEATLMTTFLLNAPWKLKFWAFTTEPWRDFAITLEARYPFAAIIAIVAWSRDIICACFVVSIAWIDVNVNSEGWVWRLFCQFKSKNFHLAREHGTKVNWSSIWSKRIEISGGSIRIINKK